MTSSFLFHNYPRRGMTAEPKMSDTAATISCGVLKFIRESLAVHVAIPIDH